MGIKLDPSFFAQMVDALTVLAARECQKVTFRGFKGTKPLDRSLNFIVDSKQGFFQ